MEAERTVQRLTIYTIGHSNLSADAFCEALKVYQVKELVDVRSTPYSRFSPQFNRENLAFALKEIDISYRFAGESLGGRPTDPTCYRNHHLPLGHANYLELVDYDEVAKRPWFQAGLARLLEVARWQTTAIMCSEEDPLQCHRYHLITQSILPDARVLDIRTGGGRGLRLVESELIARQPSLI